MKKPIMALLVVLLGGIALSLGLWVQQHSQSQNKLQLVGGAVIPVPPALIPFKLTASDGKVFDNQQLQGHWSLLFFGFSNCPALCPTTLTTLSQVYQQLAAKHQELPQIVFISVDPQRDSLAKIQTYVQQFNPHFLGATGDDKTLQALAQQLGVMFAKIQIEGDSSGAYTIDHSGTILVIDPQGRFYAELSTPHQVNNIVSDYQKILTHYQESTHA